MVLRWEKQLERMDLEQLDSNTMKQFTFVPTASDYAALEKEHEKPKSSKQNKR